MEGGLNAKVGALVLCGGVVAVLAPACDLSYTCDTVVSGGEDYEIPTESVGAGDFPNNGEEDGGGGEEVASVQLEMAGSCSPSKDCYDFFADCQDIGGKCTVGYPGCDKYGRTPCRTCLAACLVDKPYPPACNCYSCGFR
ncbi:hypothetical protein WMF31_00875 [Sorangium sp. So ce1036]|uniref:hypothetical protein n=1 Tax=Sorangium sp. So ce1036 TaxID=3133328 RepID=UPI003F086DFB